MIGSELLLLIDEVKRSVERPLDSKTTLLVRNGFAERGQSRGYLRGIVERQQVGDFNYLQGDFRAG